MIHHCECLYGPYRIVLSMGKQGFSSEIVVSYDMRIDYLAKEWCEGYLYGSKRTLVS